MLCGTGGADARRGRGGRDCRFVQDARRPCTSADCQPARDECRSGCACELYEPLALSQPTVSHHLKKLTDAALLEREQRGEWAYFSLERDAVEKCGRRGSERSVLLMATTVDELREAVRRRYAESARAVTDGSGSCCGCGSGSSCADGESDAAKLGEALYDAEQRCVLPKTATLASLGCGNPTAVADLREGETVLDLGSGGGIDVILSAKRVGPNGVAYGLDMTDEMLAQKNALDAGVTNVHLLKGMIEQIPLPRILSTCDLELRDQSVDRQGGGVDRDRARAPAGRTGWGQRRRRGGPTDSRRTGGARLLRWLHRRLAFDERVHRRSRGCRLRGCKRGVHARGRRRDARRDCQSRQDERSGGEGTADDPAGGEGRLLLIW